MVLDTVKDVVIRDVGDKLVSTGGVAVRPFWWSTECLQALGLAPQGARTETTTAGGATGTGQDSFGETTRAAGGSSAEAGDGGNGGRDLADAGLSRVWIAVIAGLAVLALAASVALAFVLGRVTRGRSPTG